MRAFSVVFLSAPLPLLLLFVFLVFLYPVLLFLLPLL